MARSSQASIERPAAPASAAGARPNRANARQRAQRAETRDRLIEGARRVFTELGYANATIEHVLAEAKVSRASCYAHFAGKAELVAAIAERFSPVWQPLYAELAAMRDPSPEALLSWCARHVMLYREHQDTCIILTQAAAIEPDLYWQLARYQEEIIERLARSIPELSHLADDRDARIRAALVLSNIDHTCYFLAVRRWAGDPAVGISAMASNVGRFFAEERLARAASTLAPEPDDMAG